MKILVLFLSLLVFQGCDQGGGSSSGTDNRNRDTVSNKCLDEFYSNKKIDTFGDIAEEAFKSSQECNVGIVKVAEKIRTLQGIRYE